ncbi:MAG TPA: uroporphyrinogen decarboxylase family protein [Candidatus Atribacteria bacterium]|nr:uroporphyrinogen decarboxylase family protein [Candidatus Atribacteria bacterium]
MRKFKVPLEKPEPNFSEFKDVLSGKKPAQKVHFAELFADIEVIFYITENILGNKVIHSPQEDFPGFWKQEINFWYRMGYDYIRVAGGLNFPQLKGRVAEDTALLSRGERSWIEETTGVISSWRDFEEYPWPTRESFDYSHYEFISRNLPQGMKMMICPTSGVFEISSEYLLGFEGMSYLLYEDYKLVKSVFDRVGEIIYEFYENIITLDNVEGIFQGDDLGFKTSTILSPRFLRDLVFPWHKKYAELAHRYDKMYWLHCCGNILEVIEDLIDYLKIDALHSFQDTIMPVTEFKKKYGERIALLGGVDVDKLCRLEEQELRSYVRDILHNCMPYRYALGSGNTVTNYVPVENYLIMLDEGARYYD